MADAKVDPSFWIRLQRIWPFFSASRKRVAVVIFATAVGSATEPLIPALLQPLLDSGFRQGGLDPWIVPAALIGLFAVRGLAGFVAQWSSAYVMNHGLTNLRKALFAKILSVQMSMFETNSSSSLTNTVVYEVQNGAQLLLNSLLTLARDTLTLIALVGFLLFINWQLTLIVMCLFPAVAVVMRVLSRRLYRLTRESQSATDALAYVVEENVLAHRDVRLYAEQGEQAARFEQQSHSLYRLSMKATIASSAMTPMTQMLAAFALSAVISVALAQSASNNTSVGGFVAFVTAMLMLVAPIKHLSEIASPITRGLAAIEKGLDLLKNFPDEAGGTFTKKRATGDIKFIEASVSYGNSKQLALNSTNLEIRSGEILALVGSSGAGKTTLANALPRFLELSSGRIELDGHDICDWQLDALRLQFSMVSQHVVMFNDTLAANITLGSAYDQEKLIDCLKASHLEDFVNGLPEGLNTMVGHNAMNLSGGQRQRLAIARALYKDAPVLIMDEATSALDAESERAVQDGLRVLMQGRTSIVVAHRLATVQHAHRIVVMDAGEIVEIGTHEELMSQNGHYAHFYQLGLRDTPPPEAPVSALLETAK